MEIILKSLLLVFVTEMGDKTQLLAFVLATRFRKPFAILAGILVATIINHLFAASFGSWVSQQVPPIYLRWILSGTFFIFAVWALIPDKDSKGTIDGNWGAFLASAIAFFLAEMGDKTQLSTVALAAKYDSIALVTIGTTFGMMLADGPAVFFGERITAKISMVWIRRFASALFFLFGVLILLER